MTSLNGDVFVMRNGRSTSQVSIYNYPEHLNPFYEDDQHKRLRFWHIGKKGGNNGERRSSFSLDGLKDVWAFKSFRLKKKSSTLGINKTSESPPPLRRDVLYGVDMRQQDLTLPNNQSRYSTNDAASNNNNFPRNAVYRSSLQNVHTAKPSPAPRTDFNRNDHYRSTIQMGTRVSAAHHAAHSTPPPRRYVYGGSVTPQPLRNSRGVATDSITHGSSQISVASTNPFDSDEEDENEVIGAGERQLSNSMAAKRAARKKRRAPPPPPIGVHRPTINNDDGRTITVVNHSTLESSQLSSTTVPEVRLHIDEEENISIANLTAEIESLVKTTNEDTSDASGIAQHNTQNTGTTDSLKEASAKLIAHESTSENPPIQSTASITTKTTHELRENHHSPIKPPKRRQAPTPEREVGHVECIHVHVGSARSTPEPPEPQSRLTSFRTATEPQQVQSSQTETKTITGKTSFTLTSPPTVRRENQTTTTTTTTTTINKPTEEVSSAVVPAPETLKIIELNKTEEQSHKSELAVKPPVPTKPNFEHKSRINTLAEIHKPSKGVVVGEHDHLQKVTVHEVKAPEIKAEQRTSDVETKTTMESPTVTKRTTTTTKTITFVEEKPLNITESHENKQIVSSTSHQAASNSPLTPASTSSAISNLKPAEARTPQTSLAITESHENLPSTSSANSAADCAAITSGTVSPSSALKAEEFEYLYRPKPMSAMEWKQSSLAPLEPNVPPEKRKSVKDIIESINRSQRLLTAAAIKDPTRAVQVGNFSSGSSGYNTPVAQRKFSEPNGNIKNLEDAQRDLQRIYKELSEAENAMGQANGLNGGTTEECAGGGPDICVADPQKPNNSEVFQKCTIKKEVYDYRETSPTTSNLDWNPVPKPKRNKNITEH